MPGTIDGGHMQRVLTLPGVVLFFITVLSTYQE